MTQPLPVDRLGNSTGFMTVEHSMGAKWLELLKQVAPSVTRAAVIRDPTTPSGIGQFGAIQTVAPSLGVEVNPVIEIVEISSI
jgi:putative ABC transport system substrate-binding protein